MLTPSVTKTPARPAIPMMIYPTAAARSTSLPLSAACIGAPFHSAEVVSRVCVLVLPLNGRIHGVVCVIC